MRKVDEHPVLVALRNAPKGDPSLLTAEDRAHIAANRAAGAEWIPHEVVMAMLEERKRQEGG